MTRRPLRALLAVVAGPLVGLLAGISALAIPSASAAPSAAATYLVTFRGGVDAAAEAGAARAAGLRVGHVFGHAVNGMSVDLTPAQASAMAANPLVSRVEADAPVHLTDTQSGATWGIDRVDQTGLPLNGTYTYATSPGAGVTAYVVDTGVRGTHTELTGRVGAGYTSISDGNGTTDCNGHGTHVAGTIGGTTYGLAKSVTIVPVRVLDCTGSGTTTGVVAGLDWIAANNTGPAVANMSLGGGASATLDSAVANVISKGVLVMVAAGNSNLDACTTSPARTPSAVTVGATTNTDTRASYSNFGTCLDLFAPGSGITSSWSTSDTATNTISGTSMATPHVTGAAAVLLAQNPGTSASALASMLVAYTTPNAVLSAGTGSPNRLLYLPATPMPLGVGTATLANATLNVAYSATIAASGGAGSYTWAANGTLPAGLSLSSAGVLSGVPTAAGTWPVPVTVTDGKGATATASLSLTVNLPPAPGAFKKSSPANGATGRSRTSLSLSWGAASGVTRYEVCVDKVNNNACDTSWVSTSTNRSITVGSLSSATAYYWQVRAVNAGGATLADAGVWWKFTTA